MQDQDAKADAQDRANLPGDITTMVGDETALREALQANDLEPRAFQALLARHGLDFSEVLPSSSCSALPLCRHTRDGQNCSCTPVLLVACLPKLRASSLTRFTSFPACRSCRRLRSWRQGWWSTAQSLTKRSAF